MTFFLIYYGIGALLIAGALLHPAMREAIRHEGRTEGIILAALLIGPLCWVLMVLPSEQIAEMRSRLNARLAEINSRSVAARHEPANQAEPDHPVDE